MEPVGVFLNEDFDSLSKMFSADEDFDFSLQFLQGFGNPLNLGQFGDLNANANENLAVSDENVYYSAQNLNSNFYFSQESTNSSVSDYNVSFFPSPSLEKHNFYTCNMIPVMNDISESVNICLTNGQNSAIANVFPNDMQDIPFLKEEKVENTFRNDDSYVLSPKRKFEEVAQQPKIVHDLKTNSAAHANPKKKSRVPRETPKHQRNAQTRNNQKMNLDGNDNEESTYGGLNGQSSSSYSSEDDSNASQELNGGATLDSKGCVTPNSSVKARASRGAATDPQSLYARRRREKINERLRILQNLVPNGTKVDISTMLEEAVHYVKFLQLQIKLLSSDDMWMYSPIAYNGMDMGLYQKICPTV